MGKQKTIAKAVSVEGVGLHTGVKVRLELKPAEPNSGITFIRTDLNSSPAIRALPENIITPPRSPRRTSLGREQVQIHTIEHLMSALAGLAIDNINIELDNEEVPGLDGSSLSFVELINRAGIKEQEHSRHYYSVKEPVVAEEDGASLIALPAQELRISYTLNYNHPLLKAQFLDIAVNPETFREQLAPSRTFCLESEAGELREQGFGRGANYQNTLVVGKKGVIKNKLRYPDEFIRHKILDLLGDLYILGTPLKCHIIALRSGHSLNLKLIRKIEQQKQRYSTGGVAIEYQPQKDSQMDRQMIMKILPHRDPFLFVDKIISMEEGKRAVGLRNVDINDYFFKGHFPGKPVMPGVLIIETMAQVGGVMMLSPKENRGKIAYFMSIDNAKFRKPVVPGDQLILEVEAGKIKSRTGIVHGKALVNGKVVAEADLMFALAEV